MKPVDFDYVRPASIVEAVGLLTASDGLTKIMAGGQTLGPMLNLRFVQPDRIIDIRHIAELIRVEESAGALVLGACTTHAAIEDGRVPDVTRGMMTRVAGRIAYRAVRTRGTLGGSLAHSDPAADWVSCLTALDAAALISGPRGRRDAPLFEFVRGALDTTLAADEIIDAVRIPKLSPGSRWGYHKICRKTGEFAEAIGAVVICGGRCRIVAGATRSKPVVIDLSAGELGKGLVGADIAARLTDAGLDADGYELSIHAAAVRRAIEEAIAA